MALSTTAKAGLGGLGTISIGGPVATYASWDHITLYSVEREVINKDLTLTVGAPTGTSDKSMAVTVTGLEGENKWSCSISIDSEAIKYIAQTNLEKHIQGQLSPTNQQSVAKQNKRWLVKTCAKDRKETPIDKSVKGSLTITVVGENQKKFTFKENSNLDFLLEDVLFEVEEKVFSESLELQVAAVDNSNPKKLKVTVKDDNWKDETNKNYWECQVTVPTTPAIDANKLAAKLPDSSTKDDAGRVKNKKILVQECSKNRSSGSTEKKVKATLDLSHLKDVTEDQFFSTVFK